MKGKAKQAVIDAEEKSLEAQKLVAEVKSEILALLVKYGVEIVPTLKYTDMGILPEVRIVKVDRHEEDTSKTAIPVQE